MQRRRLKVAGFALIAGVAIGGLFAVRLADAARAREEKECRALTAALDKTVRERTPRRFEGIAQHRYDRAKGRCLAALEYHYKPCGAKRTKTPAPACVGPDADIAIYAVQGAEARPLFVCERTYAPPAARCIESVYGDDGALLSTREIPPDQFPAIKAELIGSTPLPPSGMIE